MSEETFFGFTNIKLSKDKMADILYALIMVKGRLHSSIGSHLDRYNRSQNCTHQVPCVFEMPLKKVERFEELTGLKLNASKEFQGTLTLNTSPKS